jgi:hypothetical protein
MVRHNTSDMFNAHTLITDDGGSDYEQSSISLNAVRSSCVLLTILRQRFSYQY